MKWISFLLLLVISLSQTPLNAQLPMLPIDSLYLKSVEQFYQNATGLASDGWPGMSVAPFCLFRENGPAILFNHPDPPTGMRKVNENLYVSTQAELQLFGATQIDIIGELTAVTDYTFSKYSSTGAVFSELFHELHHVYQRNEIPQLHFDNPVTLLTYPENYRNDALKNNEQQLFYRLTIAQDQDELQNLLNLLYSTRLNRETIIGKKYIDYEKSVESCEGPAFYCQYLFYKRYNREPADIAQQFIQTEFFGPLTTPQYGREKLRRRHLSSGMAMCYILDTYFDNWKTDYYASGESLYNFFLSKFQVTKIPVPEDDEALALSQYYTQQAIDQHHQHLEEFYDQAGVKISLDFQQSPAMKGFDPMHAESINDTTLLHNTLLNLQGKEANQVFISSWQAVTFATEKLWLPERLVFFVPEQNIIVKEDTLWVDNAHLRVRWTGKIQDNGNKEIIVQCD